MLKSFKEFFKEYQKENLIIQSIFRLDKIVFEQISNSHFENILNQEDQEPKRKYLTNDEQVQLIKIYQADPTSTEGQNAIQTLVKNKMDYINSKARKFLKSHDNFSNLTFDDVVQEGYIALMDSIEKYDTNSGVIFNGFLNRNLEGKFINAINTQRHASIDYGKTNKKNGKAYIDSLDATISGERGQYADADQTIGDKIADTQMQNPFDQMNQQEEDQKKAMYKEWLNQLPPIQKKAIQMYFPEDPSDKKTFDEIAQAIGLKSKMGVKKLMDRVLEKLKDFARESGFTPSDDSVKDISKGTLGKNQKANG